MLTVSQMTKLVKFRDDLINALQYSVPVETVESVREIKLCNDVVIWNVVQETPSGEHISLTAYLNCNTQLEGCKIVG